MDVVRISDTSIKIKGKNSTFIVNPSGKIDTEVLVFTKKPTDYSGFASLLVIDGPGDFETAGMSIKGEKAGDQTSFDFFEDNQRLLVISASGLSAVKETEGYTATVVIADEKVGDNISSVTSDVVAIVGSEDNLPVDRSNIKKTDKLNLKKTDEFKGFVVHLSK